MKNNDKRFEFYQKICTMFNFIAFSLLVPLTIVIIAEPNPSINHSIGYYIAIKIFALLAIAAIVYVKIKLFSFDKNGKNKFFR